MCTGHSVFTKIIIINKWGSGYPQGQFYNCSEFDSTKIMGNSESAEKFKSQM